MDYQKTDQEVKKIKGHTLKNKVKELEIEMICARFTKLQRDCLVILEAVWKGLE